MKNNKKMIAVLLASVMVSATASASEKPNFLSDNSDNSSAKEVSITGLKIDKSDVNKVKSDSEVVSGSVSSKTYANIEAYIDPKIASQRSAEISKRQYDLEILKLDMQNSEIQNTLNNLKAEENQSKLSEMIKEKEDEWNKERASIIADYDSQISSLKKQLKLVNKKMENDEEVRDFLKNKLFVTKTYGIGNNKHAKFYFENNITTLSVGQEIIPGAKVVRIDNNGAEVSYKNKTAFLTITTQEYAHSKTIAREELEFQKTLEQAKYGVMSAPSDIGGIPPMPR